ncbi:MAG TPA: efflux RND transporter periplasmic adaptor subunit [Xanthobacteraceae bacterium]|jgi:membrane fusion protein (multidrug efflux system)|nr:efflux RND transporter periplasmic adaptor subunit [Xanthobacteraceae bacterium]
MTKRMTIMLIAVLLVFGGVFGFQIFKNAMIKKFMTSMAPPPQTVSTVTAATQDWQPQIEAVGSLRAVNGADLAFEVSGIVKELHFNSGDEVAAGDILVKLRADDDIAKLDALKATAALSEITLQRDQEQFKIKAVSQATLDTDSANLKNAKAQVAEQEAVIAKKTLRAPFAGHLGVRAVDIGQYISAGTTVVTLQALDPIYADFFLPQQTLNQIRLEQAVTIKVDTYPNKDFAGTITAINPKVDPATRNVQVRATLKNPDRLLLPGMYATVNVAAGEKQRYVTLPQTAVTYNPYGETVYVVDDKGTNPQGQPQLVARQVFVTAGLKRGDQVAILSGVEEGQTVVTAGQMKLRNGAPVMIDNTIRPTAEANPIPIDQ